MCLELIYCGRVLQANRYTALVVVLIAHRKANELQACANKMQLCSGDN